MKSLLEIYCNIIYIYIYISRYDIRLAPVKIETIIRNENEKTEFNEDSLFMIRYSLGRYLKFGSTDFKNIPHSADDEPLKAIFGRKPADDFLCSFKFMSAIEMEELNAKLIGDYLPIISGYTDERTLMDYTRKSQSKLFNHIIRELTQFCNNELVIRINHNDPFKEPNEVIQKVYIIYKLLVNKRMRNNEGISKSLVQIHNTNPSRSNGKYYSLKYIYIYIYN